MRCPNCNSKMKNVMHFEKGKNFAYHQCINCPTQTRPKCIHFEEFERGEKNKNSGRSKKIQIR